MTAGFGEFDTSCPENPDGHVWSPPDRRLIKDDGRSCVHCGVVAREHLAAATDARCEFFQTLKAPASAHGTPRKKA